MRILMTGSSGFIGKSLIYKEFFVGHELVCSNRSTNWKENLGEFNLVIHLAGRAHDKGAVWQDFVDNNIQLTKDILENLKKNSPQAQFLFFSTCKVYGEQSFNKAFCEDDQLKFETDYGKSKAVCEELVRESGLNYIVLRSPLVVGDTPKGNLGLVQKISNLGLPFPKNINNRRSLCSTHFIETVVRKVIVGKIPTNQIYNLSEFTISTTDIFRKNGCHRFINFPPFLFRCIPDKIGIKLFGNFEVNGSKLNEFLN